MSNDSENILGCSLLAPPGMRIDLTNLNSKEARQLEGYVKSITEHSMNSAYGRQPLPDSLSDLTYGHPGIQALTELKSDWDGYNSSPPSQTVIEKANDVWNLSVGAFGRALELPAITPGSSGIVAFTWKNRSKQRQLELWVHDNPSFSADWCILNGDGSTTEREIDKIDDVLPALKQLLA